MPLILKNREETAQINTAQELRQAKQALGEALVPINTTQIYNSGYAINIRVNQNVQALNQQHEGIAESKQRGKRAELDRPAAFMGGQRVEQMAATLSEAKPDYHAIPRLSL